MSYIPLIKLSWADQGKCYGDPEKDHVFFYPQVKGSRKPGGRVDEVEAQRALYCSDCPVRIKCLEHALENREQGVWGGTTEDEREQIRRSRENKKRKSA